MATSLDGKISFETGQTDKERLDSGFLIPEDQDILWGEITKANAVIIGGETLRTEGKVLELKDAAFENPTWFILTQKGFSQELPFWRQEKVKRKIFSPNAITMPEDRHGYVENITYQDEHPVRAMVHELKKQNASRVLLFGGGKVNLLFYQLGLVDELILTVSPFIFAGKESADLVAPGLKGPVSFLLQSSQPHGNHVFLKYKVVNK